MSLGLSMIVKNESAVLRRALSGICRAVDEVVIVDTGSTDDTVKIAREFTDKVYSFEWIDDFSAARNFALSKLTTDKWMWMDADDIVPERTANKIKKLASSDADIVMLPYVAATDENGKPTFAYYRERIIKAKPELVWRGCVHEAVALAGKIEYAAYPVIHAKPNERTSGSRNLDIYRSMLARGKALEPRERYYYARELYYNGHFAEAAVELDRFIDDKDGFYVNKIDACILLSRCFFELGKPELAMRSALNGLGYGVPSGECCCEIGALFLAKGDYAAAAHWYERALRLKPKPDTGAFIQAEYYGFVPFMQLTVCYDKLGKPGRAFEYHRRAKRLKPRDPSVIANSAYFKSIGYSLGN